MSKFPFLINSYCRRGFPHPLFVYVHCLVFCWLITSIDATCGNGILEEPEECDCGSVSDCKDPCCRALVCTLKEGAECSNLEPCCKECKFKSKWKLCRPAENECDLPEYCSGKDFSCPPDIFRRNGHNCSHDNGYCFNGQCQTHQLQCNLLFTDRLVTPATEHCYVRANGEGSESGNCGNNRACMGHDALCGSLQCIEASQEFIGSNLPFDYSRGNDSNKDGTDHVNCPLVGSNPPLVHDYTKCSSGKICLNQKCVNLTSMLGLKGKCPNGQTNEECSGHGDCTSSFTCQCHKGWEGSNCSLSEPEIVLKSPASTVKTGIIHDIPVTRAEDEGPITHKHAGEDDTNYTLGMVFAVAVVTVSITFFICALVYCYLFSSPISKAKESLDSQGDDYSMDTTNSNQQIHSVQNMEVTVSVQEPNGSAIAISLSDGAPDQVTGNGSCHGSTEVALTIPKIDKDKKVASSIAALDMESRNGDGTKR
ncbi:unnamed protein product [Allacma fusca]|uniref:Disintegrin domain-containing protein n=1 Tax=Allacma fusca TaxID=39272 RepID=A0A8J2PLV0_9HEXA|nr:unnamed protein product [Allacma fusca]